MSIYFADTSAFAKRYLPESGSAWVESWINPESGHYIILSALGTVEFLSLLSRRQREGDVSIESFFKLRDDFLTHVQHQYRVIALTAEVIDEAQKQVTSHPLRALDALQLASAIMAAKILAENPIFVSADTKLLAVASLIGFTTDNPNLHT